MIESATGNLLTAQVDALVNTVNTHGVMGKGIALQFARAFPEMVSSYQAACRRGELAPGRVHVYAREAAAPPRWLINFPTKRHWRERSHLQDIEAGLVDLVRAVRELGIRSIAIPPLGCGLGGLHWEDVRLRIEAAFATLPDVRVLLYSPQGAPAPAEQPVRTRKPALTAARARVIEVLAAYLALGYELSLLEVHKLLYFLQVAGEPLKLNFGKGRYGPFASNLRQVLSRFEGHYTRGYGDGSDRPDIEIELLPDAQREAAEFLAAVRAAGEQDPRLQRVVELIEGYESPYGLELLASVQFVANDAAAPARTLDDAVAAIHAWTDRKRRTMPREHIELAWRRLQELGWIVADPPPQTPPSQDLQPVPTTAGRYGHLDREALIRLLERRDAERQLGLVWEREELDPEAALNEDFVALELDPALSHGEGPWHNLIIEGDNYDALRHLRMTHAGRIRCIYIDPPYNTGNRDFVYNDRFVDKSHRFRHSLWLEFMHRRLTLARDLLAEDGVIFVSIDDNELFRLGMLMDRIFGETNKQACLVWQTDGNFDNQAKIKTCHEYILVYSASADKFAHPSVTDPNIDQSSKLRRSAVRNTIVKNGPKNPISALVIPAGFPASFEAGVIPARQDKWPTFETDIVVRDWRTTSAVEVRSGWANKKICHQFCKDGFKPVIDTKGQATTFEINANGTIENVKIRAVTSHAISVLRNMGSTQRDGALLRAMGLEFTYPKPVEMMAYLIGFCSDKNATVLDFFAGSGTTAHAVARLNAEDGGNRRFILVSSTEATVDAPNKNLCRDVCAERVRRVLAGYTNNKGESMPGLGGGFAYLRARRVPRHRLARRLGHAEIWHALRLIHDLPLSPVDAAALVYLVDDSRVALAYLPAWRDDALAELRAWCQQPRAGETVVYTWTPERFADWPASIDWRPIPESLRLRFGGARA